MHISLLTFLSVIGVVCAKDGQKKKDEGWSTTSVVVFGLVLTSGLVGLALYYDRKNGFAYSRAVRGKIGDCIMMVRRKRSYTNELGQKIETEDNATARAQMYDHQKTYIDAAHQPNINPATEQILHQQPILAEEIKPDHPQPDFKGVFQIKESKSKHKINKKSKSKLKGRLLGKGSDNEEEQGEARDLSNMTDENQNQNEVSRQEGSVSEEYKVMEEETEES